MLRLPFALVCVSMLSLSLTVDAQQSAQDAPTPKTPAKKGKNRDTLGFDPAKFSTEYDRDKDGFLTRKELPRTYRDNFEKMDSNKDGKLSQKELRQGHTHLHANRRPADLVFILVEMSDCDPDCPHEVQCMYDRLKKIDKNNDGDITSKELELARKNLVRKRVDATFSDLDANKDGKLNKNEVRGQLRSRFKQVDLNSDGQISRQELNNAASASPADDKRRQN